MQNGQKKDAFRGRREATASQQPFDDLGDLQFVPQSREDQCRSDAAVADGGGITTAMRGKYQHGFSELGSRLQKAVELSALLKLIKPAHRGYDALLATSFFPAILYDLQIDVTSRSLLAEEHDDLRTVSRELPP